MNPFQIQDARTLCKNFLSSKLALWCAGAVVLALLCATLTTIAHTAPGHPIAAPAVTNKSKSNIPVVTDQEAGTSTPSTSGMGVLQPTGSLAAPAGAVNQGSGLNLQAGATPVNATH